MALDVHTLIRNRGHGAECSEGRGRLTTFVLFGVDGNGDSILLKPSLFSQQNELSHDPADGLNYGLSLKARQSTFWGRGMRGEGNNASDPIQTCF